MDAGREWSNVFKVLRKMRVQLECYTQVSVSWQTAQRLSDEQRHREYLYMLCVRRSAEATLRKAKCGG